MDPNLLLQCFAGTLEVSQSVREHAESQLRQLSRTPGFLGACLDIIAAPEVPAGCRKAAAVYFKNRVVRLWNNPAQQLDDGEKPVVRDRIVRVLALVDHATKQQLIPVLRVLVSFEYPDQWPQLLHATGELLQKQDGLLSMYTGVLCFSEICRYYRWVDNKQRSKALDPILEQVFPHLLAVGNAILALELSELSAEILKLILKCYKFVTYYDLPAVLQTKDALALWGDFHCRVTSMDPPAYILSLLLSDLEKYQTQVSKCYKWSVANMERLFRRYALYSLSAKFNYDEFRALFAADIVPHLMQVYLSLIELWCKNVRWICNPALYHLLEFLSHAVTQKETWQILKPFFESLVSHFIYPLLCPSNETLEMFDTDPVEYINSKLDNFDEAEPDVAALGFLVTLALKRNKTTMEPIVTFAYNQLTSLKLLPEDLEVAKKKDGVLRLLGGVSDFLTQPDSPYVAQMEHMVSQLVLPNLNSSFEFLQARTLDVCSRFADVPYETPETLSLLFNGILRPFTSDSANISLPVSLQSALAIQAYITHPQFTEILSSIILPTMSKLLELSNEIDNESVSVVMQELVENFSQQLQPFGVDLMKNLVDQFLRLAKKIKEAAEVDAEDFEDDYKDISDKLTAATGLLNTMITVLLSFENSREICMTLEATFAPAIHYVLANNLDDFLAEIAELIENSIFLLRAVTPLMWAQFDLLAHSFKEGIALMYTDELALCLKNYMVFGNDHLLREPHLLSKTTEIIKLIIEGEDGCVDYNDIVMACELGLTLILSLQQNATTYISELSSAVLPVLALNQKDAAHVKNSSLMVHLVNFVTACLVNNCSVTLNLLQEHLHLKAFFEQWFALIPQLKRVFDIKLAILGLISLVNNPDSFQVVPESGATIGSYLAHLFTQLPIAIKKLEKQRSTFQAVSEELPQVIGFDSGLDNDFDGELEASSKDSDDSDDAATNEYLDFLNKENNKFTGPDEDDSEPVYEDVLGSTPLDGIDPIAIFRNFSSSLQANNVPVYNQVFGNLNDNERQALSNILTFQQ